MIGAAVNWFLGAVLVALGWAIAIVALLQALVGGGPGVGL